MVLTLRNLALLAGAALLLAACGGDPNAVAVASGGIGGTGKGTISGYGSIIINDESRYGIGAGTDLTLDGEPIGASALRALGTGFVANVVLATDADPQLLGGTALSVHVEHQLIGPITAPGPLLAVLSQRVLVNANTVLVNLGSRDALENLSAGAVLRVSGYPSGDNLVLATRVEYLSAGAESWKLTGRVSALTPDALNIGAQHVVISGVAPADCGAGLSDGDFVDIRASAGANAGFGPGSPLVGVTALACTTPGLVVPPGIGTGSIPVKLEGLVDGVSLPTFILGGQVVQVSDGTKYKDGEAADLTEGVRVEVRGTLDLQTRILNADAVRFLLQSVRIIAPLSDYRAGESVTLLGIDVEITPLTRGTAGLDTLPRPAQVQVQGYADQAGEVYAARITPQGPANPDAVSLRGPVDTLSPIGPSVFTILTVHIDVTGTGSFKGATGGQLTRQEFFAALAGTARPEASASTGTLSTSGQGFTIVAPASVRIED